MKVCIDIGGTNIRVGTVDEYLQLSNLKIFKTTEPRASLAKVVEHIKELKFEQINISTCGPVDLDTGVYGKLPNLESWMGFNLKAYLNNYFDCEILIENDANCATLYETETRVDIESLIYITISTGVGAGAVIGNKLFSGKNNEAVSPYKYYINLESTLDQSCSGTGILKAANMFGIYTQTKDVFADVKNNQVTLLLDEWTTEFALYIVNTHSILDIEKFILGGSVIVNNPSYINEIIRKVNKLSTVIDINLTSELQYNALKGAYLIDKYK